MSEKERKMISRRLEDALTKCRDEKDELRGAVREMLTSYDGEIHDTLALENRVREMVGMGKRYL